MTKKMPQIRSHMTKAPWAISLDTPIWKVQELMKSYNVRHLPVTKGAEVVGIISDRGIKSAYGLSESKSLIAEDLMTPDPFCVTPETPLVQVVSEMAEEKFGCALVKDETGSLIGIFTTVDACRALQQLLETFYLG